MPEIIIFNDLLNLEKQGTFAECLQIAKTVLHNRQGSYQLNKKEIKLVQKVQEIVANRAQTINECFEAMEKAKGFLDTYTTYSGSDSGDGKLYTVYAMRHPSILSLTILLEKTVKLIKYPKEMLWLLDILRPSALENRDPDYRWDPHTISSKKEAKTTMELLFRSGRCFRNLFSLIIKFIKKEEKKIPLKIKSLLKRNKIRSIPKISITTTSKIENILEILAGKWDHLTHETEKSIFEFPEISQRNTSLKKWEKNCWEQKEMIWKLIIEKEPTNETVIAMLEEKSRKVLGSITLYLIDGYQSCYCKLKETEN